MPRTEVRTKSGVVAGAVANGVVSWKGIPYAAPPVGELRWRSPQPVAPVDGRARGHRVRPRLHAAALPERRGAPRHTPAEDCLYLNVWAPEKPASAKLPVMIWIHGAAS